MTYTPLGENPNSECAGFFPGQASLAYFFFFGSNGLLLSVGSRTTMFLTGGGAGSTGSLSSNSGAKFGIFNPNLAAMEPTLCPEEVSGSS
jgi:hypothetical protein